MSHDDFRGFDNTGATTLQSSNDSDSSHKYTLPPRGKEEEFPRAWRALPPGQRVRTNPRGKYRGRRRYGASDMVA